MDSIQYYSLLAENADSEYDSNRSFKFFDKQLKLHEQNNNILGQVSILTSVAQIEMSLGMINESEVTAVEAIKHLDKITYESNQDPYRISLYNHLGILYKEKKNFNTSLYYYEKARKLISNPEHRITAINNLANVYREKKEYSKAIKLYQDSYQMSLSFDDKEKTARALNNLGKTQSIINLPNATSNLENALLLRKEIKYYKGIASSYISLGEHYKRNGNFSKALDYSKKALSVSYSSNRIEEKLAIMGLQFDLGYFDNYSEFKRLYDSVENARNISTNLYAAIKYDKENAINRANKSELNKEKERAKKILFQTIGLIILLTSTFLYFLLKSKHKKEKLQQVYNTETRISRKVHDEVANDIYHVMTKLQRTSNENHEILDDLESIYTRTRDISKENNTIETNEHFEQLIIDLLSSYKNAKVNVITKDISKINWDNVKNIKKVTLYRVLQELMTNMKKHSEATVVVLAFHQSQKHIIINYTDNGKGCRLEKNNGLLNAENRIATINGTITFESEINKGFKAKITI